MQAQGKGDLVIKTPKGTILITNVLYVPKLSENLLSVPQLMKKGYTLKFLDTSCEISKNGKVVLFVHMKDNSLVIDFNQQNQSAMSTKVQEDSQLWHRRFGHFNYATLKQMQTQQIVENLPQIQENDAICQTCQFGKLKRQPFPLTSLGKTVEKLQVVHSDLCGPMNEFSHARRRYFVIFIDDYSRKCWICFLKQKSEVAATFE